VDVDGYERPDVKPLIADDERPRVRGEEVRTMAKGTGMRKEKKKPKKKK
jgi:hypothetical protein